MKKNVTISVDEGLWRRFSELKWKEKKSVSGMVEDLIRGKLDKGGAKMVQPERYPRLTDEERGSLKVPPGYVRVVGVPTIEKEKKLATARAVVEDWRSLKRAMPKKVAK